jgi:cell division protein FtsA
MNQRNLVTAIDVGTTKTVVLMGEIQRDRSLRIIGIHKAQGILTLDDDPARFLMSKEILSWVLSSATTPVRGRGEVRPFVSLTGPHLETVRTIGGTPFRDMVMVKSQDIELVEQDAARRLCPEDRQRVHTGAPLFFLDGKPCTRAQDVIGLSGKRLDYSRWTISAAANAVRRLSQVTGARIDDFVVSSFASASMVTDEAMRRNGVLVIDIGGGVTDYMLYLDGVFVQAGVIPMGGDQITKDLSVGLGVSLADAEEIKTTFARACVGIPAGNSTVIFPCEGPPREGREFQRTEVNAIVEKRVSEVFRNISGRLGRLGAPDRVRAGVVLTGGTALLHGIADCATATLNLPAVVGRNPGWAGDSFSGPQYSTALGVLHHAFEVRLRELPEGRGLGRCFGLPELLRRCRRAPLAA